MKLVIGILTALVIALTGMLVFFGNETALAQTAETTNSITVQTVNDTSLTDKIIHNLSESWPWYIARGSGIIAAITLIVLMVSGIGQITGTTFRFLDPIVAWASHRALGIVFGISIGAHVISLLFDSFLKITIVEALVPWVSDYRPVTILGIPAGSLYLALGIIAFYLSLAIVVTSLLFISKKPYFWKIIHLTSYAVLALVFFHALYIGTDFAHGWLRVLWIIVGISLAIFSIIRLRRAFTT
jgi:hypothetical protein